MMHMIETIPDLPAGTAGFRASGVVTADDYRTVVEPALAAAHEQADAVNLVYVIGDDVERFTLGAMMQDAEVGRTPAKEWGRIAVVTDKHWITGAVHLFLHVYPCEVKTFAVAEEDAAVAWATGASATTTRSPSR